jgi:hypothetical protein
MLINLYRKWELRGAKVICRLAADVFDSSDDAISAVADEMEHGHGALGAYWKTIVVDGEAAQITDLTPEARDEYEGRIQSDCMYFRRSNDGV